MPGSTQQRIEDALSQLVERLQPLVEGEDEAAADERYFNAYDTAKDLIDNVDAPAVAPDENHVAEIIKRRLVRENNTPDTALQFNNLFSRLLSRPVLNQKWAILYLLNQLSEQNQQDVPNGYESPHPAAQPGENVNGARRRSQPFPQSDQPHATHESRLYDEAFSRQGLPSILQSRNNREVRSPDHQPLSRPSEPPRRNRHVLRNENPPDASSSLSHRHWQIPTPTESSILRDLPFTLQGVSSTQLLFPNPSVLKFPQNLPVPLVSLLHSLAEPSLLYKSLSAFVESPAEGLIGQSLRAAIGTELRQYLSLVATLESQIRRALAQVEESSNKVSLGKAGVTLKRCVIWTREATLGLRLMTVIVDECRIRKDGQAISLIHQYAIAHGDPFVGNFAERILGHVTRPFYEMLRAWIYDGELSDPYNEFFVSEQDPSRRADDNAQARGAATSVWEDKYMLNESMIPTIITEDFARRVFLIGKSLNFIRTACADSAWVQQYSKSHSRELRYSDTATLVSSIDEAYSTTMAQLIHLMTDKFHLLRHLTALKKYLLLGQGDFITLLMESLAGNLDRPANSQYRHTLTAQLEHAIRGSNAQYEHADVLRRLDARMLELSMGEIGWDVFTLEYKVDAPVDVIVTPHANIQYLKVFNFLWRVKRVEYALGATWRRTMTGARGFLKTSTAVTEPTWKSARCTISEMTHFTRQLLSYILSSVIESAFTTLVARITSPTATLDDLISAHSSYLKSITRKGLLSSTGQPTGSLPFATQLHELLKLMLSYRDTVEGLYALCVTDATRETERRARIERRTARGEWGTGDRDDNTRPHSSEADSPFPPPPLLTIGANGVALNDAGVTGETSASVLRTRLRTLSSDFRTKLCGLLGDLAHQPDPDLRFLGVFMNFNDVYRVVRRRRQPQGSERTGLKDREKDRGTASASASASASGVAGKERSVRTRGREERAAEKGGGG